MSITPAWRAAQAQPKVVLGEAGVIAGGAVRDSPHLCQSARKAHLSDLLYAHLTGFVPIFFSLPSFSVCRAMTCGSSP
jgi:hypothetical protein